MSADARICSPAAARNRQPILDVLLEVLPEQGRVLEIASGGGEHVCFWAARLPRLEFQPSDPEASARDSIEAWIRASAVPNVRPPLAIDVREPGWSDALEPVDALINVNMIHISPWSACEGLLAGAARLLDAGGPLLLYGPYRRAGRHTAPSNERFDESLRARDPRFGVRDLEAVVACAERSGLDLERVVEMPANNLSVVLRRRG